MTRGENIDFNKHDIDIFHEVNNVTNAFVRVNKQRRDVHAYK
jgi:hypothetical protein